MAAKLLFNQLPIHLVVEDKKRRLGLDFDRLSDEDAMDEERTQALKNTYRMDVPRLELDQMKYEVRDIGEVRRVPGAGLVNQKVATEYVMHIPFVGDPGVFEIVPSAQNGTVATGEIHRQELLLYVQPPHHDYSLDEHVAREVGFIEWRLKHLRGSVAYLDNELEATLRGCIAARKRVIDNRTKTVAKLNIPRWEPPKSPVNPSITQPPRQEASPVKSDHWDVFISHASEDKPYVDTLKNALEAAGVSVWYDKSVIRWGDDIRQKIDEGLKNCEFGIVVFSKKFIERKKWTEYELSGLFGRETVDQKRILPIRHDITQDEVKGYSDALALRLSLSSKHDSLDDIVRELLDLLGRPAANAGGSSQPESATLRLAADP